MTIELYLWNADRPALIDDAFAHLAKYRWRVGDQRGYVMRYCERAVYRENEDGELIKRIERKQQLHHAVVGHAPPGLMWDHFSRDKLDNRLANLRLVPAVGNAQNRSAHKCNVTGLRGVHLRKDTGRYLAHARQDGKNHHLGYFDTPDEAFVVARAWRLEHMPFTVES